MRWRVSTSVRVRSAAFFLSPFVNAKLLSLCKTTQHIKLAAQTSKPVSANNHATPRKRPMKGTRSATPKSASLLFNNCAANGKMVAYTAYSTAVVVPESAVLTGASVTSQAIEYNEPDGNRSAIRGYHYAKELLRCLAAALQLYTPDAQRLLHVVTAAETTGTRSTHVHSSPFKMVLLSGN